jgi:hypothetical protein
MRLRKMDTAALNCNIEPEQRPQLGLERLIAVHACSIGAVVTGARGMVG